MDNDFLDRFIPSKDTRAYLRSIHHEFTDLEKATIVANHIMISYEEKVDWLKNFRDTISDEMLKERISKALVQIKKDKKYYRKSNNALGALAYNDALFDFVFIPHDFRHGDIVRSLYGDWNTTIFAEKVGIILNYFDEDYVFYKNLQGDYSDVQVCVDIKFDGVSYQGEFEHEHINPIYIERMSLNENDERRAYLDYLTDRYIKKNHMIKTSIKTGLMSNNEVFAMSNYPGEITLQGFTFIKNGLPDDFEVCLIVEKDGNLSAGCWDTGLYSTENGKPGCFRQSRGGVIDADYVLAWLPIEKTTIDVKGLWWNPEFHLISDFLDCFKVFAKDGDSRLVFEYSGGVEEKVIFYMDVRTGNIIEIEKNGRDKIYYLKTTLREWYDDFKEKLLEDYHNGRYTMLSEWE